MKTDSNTVKTQVIILVILFSACTIAAITFGYINHPGISQSFRVKDAPDTQNLTYSISVNQTWIYDDPNGNGETEWDVKPVWNVSLAGQDAFYATSTVGPFYSGAYKAYLIEYFVNGSQKWIYYMPGGNNYAASRVGPLPQGMALFVAQSYDNSFIRFQKVGTSGAGNGASWYFNSTNSLYLSDVNTAGINSTWIVGNYNDTIPGIFLLRMNPYTGLYSEYAWHPPSTVAFAGCCTPDGAGGIYLTGFTGTGSSKRLLVAHFCMNGSCDNYKILPNSTAQLGVGIDFNGHEIVIAGFSQTTTTNVWYSRVWTFDQKLNLISSILLSNALPGSVPPGPLVFDGTDRSHNLYFQTDILFTDMTSGDYVVSYPLANSSGTEPGWTPCDFNLAYWDNASSSIAGYFQGTWGWEENMMVHITRTWFGKVVLMGHYNLPYSDNVKSRYIKFDTTFPVGAFRPLVISGAVPSEPQSLTTSPGSSQVVLNWVSPASNGGSPITNYTVYQGTIAGGERLLVIIGNVTTYTITGLTNGVTYYYKVAAVNTVGTGSNSTEASITPATVPSAPRSLTETPAGTSGAPTGLTTTPGNAQVVLNWAAPGSSGGNQITLNWVPPASNGGSAVTGYDVYQGTTAGGEVLHASIGNVTTYTATGLTNGQIYYFKVAAINTVGVGYTSAEVSPTPEAGPPITGYDVYQGTTSGGEVLVATLGVVLTDTITGLTNGQVYYFEVAAINAIGVGPKSNEASATPVTFASAPQNLVATAGDEQVLLTWSAATNNGGSPITGYNVYQGMDNPGSFNVCYPLGNVTTYTVTGLTNGHIYYYIVLAVNVVGCHYQSNEASATPSSVMASSDQNGDEWPMFRGALNHTGVATTTAVLGSMPVWSYTTGGAVESSPAVIDGHVYMGSDDHNVYCLDAATSSYMWSYTTGNYGWSSPAIANERVYVGSGDGRLYCLNAMTGAFIWSTPSYGIGDSSPAIACGRVYFGSSNNMIYCLNATNSTLIWNYVTNGGIHSSPAVTNDRVYVGSDNNMLYCLNATTGTLIWNYTTSMEVYSSPVVSGGEVYVGDDMGRVYCLNAITGAFIWRYWISGAWSIWGSPSIANGRLYVGCEGGSMYCLDATSGTYLWSYSTIDNVWSSPAVAGGFVYFGCDDKHIYCLNAITGALNWSFVSNGSIGVSSPAIANGHVYVGSSDGKLYCLPLLLNHVPHTAPQNFIAICENGQVALSWTAPLNNGGSPITGYRIYQGTTSHGETLITAIGNMTSYTSTGLTNGQTYYFQVSAINVNGEGPRSVEQGAIPGNNVPSTPLALTATPGFAQVVLNWVTPASNGGSPITHYYVFQGTIPGNERLLAVTGVILDFTSTGLTNGQIYYFKVAAANSIGPGINSTESNARPSNAYASSDQSGDEWPMFHGELDHAGTASTTPTQGSGPIWNFTTGWYVEYSTPVVANGRIYVGSDDCKLYCLNATTGVKIWSYTAGNEVRISPAVAGGFVFFGSDDAHVYCLNAITGAFVWSYFTGNNVEGSSPAIANGFVYVGCENYNVYCLNATTGALVWSYSTGNYIMSSPAVIGGRLYIGSNDHNLYCLNAITGAFLWSYTTGSGVWSSPSVVDGRVYVGSNDNNVYCLNATTGVYMWSYSTGGWVISTPAIAGGRLFVGIACAPTDKIYCLDAITGAFIWASTTGEIEWSSPAVAAGLVYVGSWDGKIYCFDASNGLLDWSYTTGGIIDSSPAISGGRVYVGSRDYNIYCLPMIISSSITPPGKPQNLSATAQNTQVTLNWAAPASDGGSAIGAYQIYMGTTPGGETWLWNITTTTYTTTGLTNGVTYYFQVAAVNMAGTGARSNEASATPSVMTTSSDQAGDEWPMFRGALNHTGLVTTTPVQGTGTIWNYTTGNGTYSSPTVMGGRVYVGSADHNVYCLNAVTGAKVWNFTTGGYVESAPAVAGIRLYVGSWDHKIYCLYTTNGTLAWSYTTGGEVDTSSPAVADGCVYVGSLDGNVYCLDAITGSSIWNYTTGNWVESSPAVSDGRVYVGSNDHNVYCLYAITGFCIWNYTTGNIVDSSPAVTGLGAFGRVYVGSDDDKVYCLNASSGTLIWSYTAGGTVDSSPAVAGGLVYVGSGDGKVYCLYASNGTKIWSYTTGGTVDSSPAVASGRVYVGSQDGNVYCLNATTGALAWNYTTGMWIFSSLAVMGGRVYAWSGDGHVYCLPMVLKSQNQVPVLSLVFSLNGRIFSNPVHLTINITSGDWPVQQVCCVVDQSTTYVLTLINGTALSGIYSVSADLTSGSHVLTFFVNDTHGNTKSLTITITVISITPPPNDSTIIVIIVVFIIGVAIGVAIPLAYNRYKYRSKQKKPMKSK